MKKEVLIQSGQLLIEIDESELSLEVLCEFASRQNPKRGFLFVSKVLGKHLPVRPFIMQSTYDKLASLLTPLISPTDIPLFLGFAETATGIGCGVYHSWQKNYAPAEQAQKSFFIHSTRYQFECYDKLIEFQEEHSHATTHFIYKPKNPLFSLNHLNTLILIDDEISTGQTIANFIASFLNSSTDNKKIKKIIIVSLKNWIDEEGQKRFIDLYPQLEIHFIQLLKGTFKFNKNIGFSCDLMPKVEGNNQLKDNILKGNYGRFGINEIAKYDFSQLPIDYHRRTLVLGTGEFLYPPFLLALYLEQKGVDLFFQSTTRSPILIGDIIETKHSFLDNYDDQILNFLYNLKPGQYEQIIICYETSTILEYELDTNAKVFHCFFDLIDKSFVYNR